MPIDMKSDMMKNMPEGMAGACQVTWEKDEEDEDRKNKHNLKMRMRMKNMMKKLTLKVIKMTMIV
jgi:hypothetical protein